MIIELSEKEVQEIHRLSEVRFPDEKTQLSLRRGYVIGATDYSVKILTRLKIVLAATWHSEPDIKHIISELDKQVKP